MLLKSPPLFLSLFLALALFSLHGLLSPKSRANAQENYSCYLVLKKHLNHITKTRITIPVASLLATLPLEYYLEYLNIFENDSYVFKYRWAKKDWEKIIQAQGKSQIQEDLKVFTDLGKHIGHKLTAKHKWSKNDLLKLDKKIDSFEKTHPHIYEALHALRSYIQREFATNTNLAHQLQIKDPIKNSKGIRYQISDTIGLDTFLNQIKLPFYFYYKYLNSFEEKKAIHYTIPSAYSGFSALPQYFYDEFYKIFIEGKISSFDWTKGDLIALNITINENMNSTDIDELYKLQIHIQKHLARKHSWSLRDIDLIERKITEIAREKPWAKEALENLKEHLKIKLKIKRGPLFYSMPDRDEVTENYFEGLQLLPEIFRFEYLNAFYQK